MDRIDLQVSVGRLKPEEMTKQADGEPSASVRARILAARDRARTRFKTEPHLYSNAQMQSQHLRQWCALDEPSKTLLESAIQRLGLSARAMDRILKVARTIADLEPIDRIESRHIAEAIQYRTIDRLQ